MKRLLLVEDDSNLGQTLVERLSREGYQVKWADQLSEARRALAEETFNLIILDVSLPDGSGFDFARKMRAQHPTPFLFVTAQGSAEARLEGYELGAEEFVPKPFHFKELLMRIEHVLRNHRLLKELDFEGLKIDFDQRLVERADGACDRLPEKDFGVLRLLIERSPAVVSRDEIIEKVWGEESFPTNRTVDNVIVRLRQAIGEPHSAKIHSVRGVGYQWRSEGVSNGQ